MEEIIWRPIPGFEGLYSMNKEGEIRNEESQMIVNETKGPVVWLRSHGEKEGKSFRVLSLTKEIWPELFPPKKLISDEFLHTVMIQLREDTFQGLRKIVYEKQYRGISTLLREIIKDFVEKNAN